jgi:hypothetical protein
VQFGVEKVTIEERTGEGLCCFVLGCYCKYENDIKLCSNNNYELKNGQIYATQTKQIKALAPHKE